MLWIRVEILVRDQPGQHPAQAVGAVGALIFAEQEDRRRLVGLQQVEAAQHEQEDDRAEAEQGGAKRDVHLGDLPAAGTHGGKGEKQNEQHQIAAAGRGAALARQGQRVAVGRILVVFMVETLPVMMISYLYPASRASGIGACSKSPVRGWPAFPDLLWPAAMTAEKTWCLVIHGGSGGMSRERLSAEEDAGARAGLDRALDAGAAVLADGGGGARRGRGGGPGARGRPAFQRRARLGLHL